MPSHEQHNDQQLRKEFTRMIDQHKGIILNICRLYTDRMKENVKDLYQDIVYNLWHSYRTFRGESKIESWIHSVARNTALDFQRKNRHRPQTLFLDESVYQDVAAPFEDEDLNHMYRIVEQLPPKDKQLVKLFISGIPYEDIARATHHAKKTVIAELKRIEQQLQKTYRDEQ